MLLKGEVVVQPPLVSALGGRRWLEEYTIAPRSKAVQKRCRSTYLDGVLAILRAMLASSFLSVMGFGEGALVCMGILSQEICEAAIRERHVPSDEAAALREASQAIEHVVLFAPHGFPLKSYIPMLREYVPEMACILPGPTAQVLVVVPTKGAASTTACECVGYMQGCVTEQVSFRGPALMDDRI